MLIVYLFLFGKLFPFSPFTIGFEKHELNNITIYLENGSAFNDFDEIDTFTKDVETFHRLKFRDKPEIYVFSDKNSYYKKTITKARFIAYPNGTVMISPWAIDEARQGTISLEIYLKHELSHIILFQNMGLIASYKYPQWLLEGIAVYSTNQMGTSCYPDKSMTYKILQKGNYFPPNYFKTAKEDDIILNIENPIAFKYSEFACIVDYLITTYGEEKFYQYMFGLFKNYNHNEVFKNIYKIEFQDFLIKFVDETKTRIKS